MSPIRSYFRQGQSKLSGKINLQQYVTKKTLLKIYVFFFHIHNVNIYIIIYVIITCVIIIYTYIHTHIKQPMPIRLIYLKITG